MYSFAGKYEPSNQHTGQYERSGKGLRTDGGDHDYWNRLRRSGNRAAFADLGNTVFGVDIDEAKVERITRGDLPIYEPGLEEIVVRNVRAGRLKFTTSYDETVPQSEFVFICVNTPSSFDGDADMRAVRSASEMIAKSMCDHTIVVNKSTMPIGSGDLVSSILQELKSPESTFAVVSNPEFLREGSAVADVF